jgi:predicted nucleic acid-binding protein
MREIGALEAKNIFGQLLDGDTDAHIWTATLRLSDRYGLTIYDACYLELAQRLNLPLATLDKELRAAASALGLPRRGP